MNLSGTPRLKLNQDTRNLIDLYAQLGEQAENFLPEQIFTKLSDLVRLCYEEPDDPARQEAEILVRVNDLKESIPGYVDVFLMMFPHEDSRAFIYSALRKKFHGRVQDLMDKELVDENTKKRLSNILNAHDFSIGTPPVTQQTIDFLYTIILGAKVSELRKFREVIGISGDVEEAQWNYLLDIMDQMVIQSTHYTTPVEVKNFLKRIDSTVNFKGMNGFIRTIVSGSAETAIALLKEEIFGPEMVKEFFFSTPEKLYEQIKSEEEHIFAVRIKSMRINPFNENRWFPYLSRMVFIDDSPESHATNTSMIFGFHNGIMNVLNKVHTKKLGALANTQLNLRLILEKINRKSLQHFKKAIQQQIDTYEREILELKKDQLTESDDPELNIILFKYDEFSRQIIKDKYVLSKFAAFIDLVVGINNTTTRQKINEGLIKEYETRTRAYFYSENKKLYLATVAEGGGRNQIRTYAAYLLQRKLNSPRPEIVQKCKTLLGILPNTYERTLQNHFYKNFGINVFLQKYREYLVKTENEADNQGRFMNLLIDLGIWEKYSSKKPEEQKLIKEFISALGNLERTSIADDVQMIIRDLLFSKDQNPNPFIFYNTEASWEYKDLFPSDRYDLNPFDLQIELDESGHVDWERLQKKMERIKSSFQLFDESGHLWDRFCENSSLIINDPANPSGFTDFNNVHLIHFLKFLSNSKITLFLDEAYNDAIKVEDPEEPKWRTISRYIVNNIGSYSKISVLTSLSTTKNLGATGDRLGVLAATQARRDVIDFAKKEFVSDRGNTNSLFMLVNILEVAQLAKKIKDRMDENLPKDASRYKIKEKLTDYIISEIKLNFEKRTNGVSGTVRDPSLFEGSPLHLFLLEELVSLEKLDVLDLPDDFKYKGAPFFSYYKNHLVSALNQFRINKIFRTESNRRLEMAKKTAGEFINELQIKNIQSLDSDGSFLFNLYLKDFFSFQDFEKFIMSFSENLGVALIPYQKGYLRFSLGGYLWGDAKSYEDFKNEFLNILDLFFKYWNRFYEAKKQAENKNKRTEDLLFKLFDQPSDTGFVQQVLEDFKVIGSLNKRQQKSLTISNIKSLYHAFPKESGVTINSIENSENTVFEFYENVSQCRDLTEFIRSKAFTKVYENILVQVYKKIPQLADWDINEVVSKFGKSTLLKYVKAKLEFQPLTHILDQPDELNITREILIEMEQTLFSDAKVKLMALNANEQDIQGDLARLEGYNEKFKKQIRELLLHFNLPFEKEYIAPSIEELIESALIEFATVTGNDISSIDINSAIRSFLPEVKSSLDINQYPRADMVIGVLSEIFSTELLTDSVPMNRKFTMFFLMTDKGVFQKKLNEKLNRLSPGESDNSHMEAKLVREDYFNQIIPFILKELLTEIYETRHEKIFQNDLHDRVRNVVLSLSNLMNQTRGNEYFFKYNHILIKLLETRFKNQRSSVNEMIQHGFALHKDFNMKTKELDTWNNGSLSWINDLLTRCGVIAWEQPVQTRTRIVTDAKKREFAFHKIDRAEEKIEEIMHPVDDSSNQLIKVMKVRPPAFFFANRMASFAKNLDKEDYRCKIVKKGLIKEMHIYHKATLKYLTDNYRLIGEDFIRLGEVQNFIPDVLIFLGAPEKVISYPMIGYFDLKGPRGNIKTIVTPLNRKADYFGNIKKPRLTVINEKVKEIGGIPVHGSLFAVEEEDGNLFVVQISGDSGVGKSEMLTAMMLKWLKKDLTGIRSVKLIAGDMFHVFPDKNGNLYGIGTETGDFSRVTDFDPEYIYNYYSLFESSADSNVDDLNSRSTISGLCDISMPYKINIMLTASNFAPEEAGIKRYSNPENFILYRDSHGERKEKATSSDNPHFLRTLRRYTADKSIVNVIDAHGNYLDEIFDWDKDSFTGIYYLASSYKMMDKIDPEDIVNKIFVDKTFQKEEKEYVIKTVRFDIIKNRFQVTAREISEGGIEITFLLDREFFSNLFQSLASTPSGNPFISEEKEIEIKKSLINILKGGAGGNGEGKKIQLGILSTDLGREGKEITGPQKAAEELKKLFREIRMLHPEISVHKNFVKQLINEKYGYLFKAGEMSPEIQRYNYFLFQIEQMRKAKFVRLEDPEKEVDLSVMEDFSPLPEDHDFHPLLVTPNMNIELSGFSETYEQLMWLPNTRNFADVLYSQCNQLYLAEGYNRETITNNAVLQLLFLNGYLTVNDLSKSNITEKVNRETLAAARFAVEKFIKE